MTTRRPIYATLITTAALTLCGLPEAQAAWTHTTTFRYAASTSLRVVEPDGFAVQVNEGRDTIPAVFNLPDANAYVWVTITARDGQTWRQKIEVRQRNETVLTVRYTAEAAPAPAPGSARRYIGSVANATHRCQASDRGAYRYDFMQQGNKVYSTALNANKLQSNVELPGGSYEVRIFRFRRGQFLYTTTKALSVDRDGWRFNYGC